MIISDKSHNTGLRVLEVLKILLENNITRNDIIEKIKENDDIDSVYTQEAFLKYFNTLETAGFDITKNKFEYCLKNAFYKMDLSAAEKKVLNKLVKYTDNIQDEETQKLFIYTMSKLDKYVDYDIQEQLKEINKDTNAITRENILKNIIKTFKNFIYEGRHVTITYKRNKTTTETVVYQVKEIGEKDGRYYILCFNPELHKNRKVYVDSIISYEQMPCRVSQKHGNNTIVFNVYGRLSSLYKLKPKEKVIDFGNNYMTISNTDKNQSDVLLRLLKYGENCEVLMPESARKKFISVTKEMIKNLEG